MNELDPLRDEGIAFLRKLQAAGVSAVGKVVLGTGHASDLSMPDIVPEIYQDSARALYGFAKSLKAKL
jgi:acetyl esterase/lipase